MQIVCLAILLLGTAGAASADQDHHGRGDHDHDGFYGNERDSVRAPEIDPASMISGLTLLAGALVVLRGRRAANPKG